MSPRRTPLFRGLMIVLLVAACGSSGTSAAPPPGTSPAHTAGASASAAPSVRASFANQWLAELDRLDRDVRAAHPGPFANHPEAEWNAKLAEVGGKVATATNDDERLVLLASVVAYLDTHTWISRKSGFHAYPVYLYHFTEGWFVVAALDASLIGAKLVSIGGHASAEVEDALRSLVPYDNEMGFLLNAQPLFSIAEYLHGAGLVPDAATAEYVFAMRDGTKRTEGFGPLAEEDWGNALHILGALMGDETEAVRRHAELAWGRVEKGKVYLLTVNDYGDESAQISALDAALDAGQVDRVVLDLRFLPGGSGDFRLLDVLRADKRVNRPGGLTVLIGRENASIATSIVRRFDVDSDALLVGEPTPARANNFRCDCRDIELAGFDAVVSIPTWLDRLTDDRPEIDPDVRMDLTAADFFAGRDPVLAAALKGIPAP